MARGRIWGNALGGWRKQKRNAKGQFGSGVVGFAKSSVNKRSVAGKAHRSRKKANAKAHRARVKGSAKARGREFVTTSPRRSKDIAIGAAAYTLGRSSGSPRMQSYGLQRAQRGVKSSVGRSTATYKMSKGLKKSRNRRSKDQYLADIGSSRKKRNAMKIAAGAVAVGAVAYGVKIGAIRTESNSGLHAISLRGGGRHAYASANVARARSGIVSFSSSTKIRKSQVPRSRSGTVNVYQQVSKAKRAANKRGFVI